MSQPQCGVTVSTRRLRYSSRALVVGVTACCVVFGAASQWPAYHDHACADVALRSYTELGYMTRLRPSRIPLIVVCDDEVSWTGRYYGWLFGYVIPLPLLGEPDCRLGIPDP